MEGYRKSSHAVYRCEYHFVWVPKYRYHVLVNEIKPRLKDILAELCEWQDITIIEGAISSDHIHLYVSVPPKHSPSYVMKVLKGRSAERLQKEFAELSADIVGLLWICFVSVDKLISMEIPDVHSICFHHYFTPFASTNSEMIFKLFVQNIKRDNIEEGEGI